MSTNEEAVFKRMQIKVLYSFNNSTTVFLSRSKIQHSVKIAQIQMYPTHDQQQDEEMITLGAFDMKSCAQQILKSSPENFKLNTEDYAVYYKDITEQPDEPFVSNGVMSTLLTSSKAYVIPGRVCQNLSASYLFGDKSSASSLTLEIRLKFHTIEKTTESQLQQISQSESLKRPAELTMSYPQKKSKLKSSSNAAVKATRTKSLPIFYNPHNQQIFNIINADKSNAPSKYDSKSVQDRFKSAPFLQAKVVDNPSKRKSSMDPQRAIRTRSMVQSTPLISSPINEEMSDGTDATDDTEYRENNPPIEEEDEEDEYDESSPFTPQQPPYKAASDNIFHSLPDLEDLDSKKTHTIPHNKLPKKHGLVCTNSNCATTHSISWRYFETGFHPNHLGIHRAKEFDKKHYEGMFGPLCNACYLFLRNKGFMRPEGVVKKYLQQQKYKKELKEKEASNNMEVCSGNERAYESLNDFHQRRSDLSKSSSTNHRNFIRSQLASPNHRFATPSHTPSMINQVIQNNNTNAVHNQYINNTKSASSYTDLNDFMNQLNAFGGPLTDIDPLPQDQQGITPPMMATKSNTRVINLYDESEDKENCPPTEIGDSSSPSKAEMIEFEKMMVKSFNQEGEKSSPIGHHEWISNLFGEPTPKDQNTPLDGKTPKDGKTPTELKSNGDDTESEKDEDKKLHPNLPQLRTFTTKRQPSPSQLDNKKAIVINMPSSPPLLNSSKNIDTFNEFLNSEPNQKTDNYLEEDSHNVMIRKNDFIANSSPEEVKASRIDTTTSVLSWQNANKKGRQSSTPNTDFYSTDDLLAESGKTKSSFIENEFNAHISR